MCRSGRWKPLWSESNAWLWSFLCHCWGCTSHTSVHKKINFTFFHNFGWDEFVSCGDVYWYIYHLHSLNLSCCVLYIHKLIGCTRVSLNLFYGVIQVDLKLAMRCHLGSNLYEVQVYLVITCHAMLLSYLPLLTFTSLYQASAFGHHGHRSIHDEHRVTSSSHTSSLLINPYNLMWKPHSMVT
jgi:hypothetical protein